MEIQVTVRAVAGLSRVEEISPENSYFLTYYREELLNLLRELGYTRVTSTEPREEAQPHLLAELGGHPVCICLPPAPPSPMELQALSPAQCAYCEQHYPQHEVHYAALLTNPQEQQLYLLGPLPLRTAGRWLAENPEQGQFLPPRLRSGADRYSPLLGGAAFFKLSRLLIPHVLQNGSLPRFSIQGLFTDREQGESGAYALVAGAPPTYFMLVDRPEGSAGVEFRRPLFFYGERPHAELELTRHAEDASGAVELLDKTGRLICAECAEAILFPAEPPAGQHYRWTLSLVADRCRVLPGEFAPGAGPLRDHLLRDYERVHGQPAPQGAAIRISTRNMRAFHQEPGQSYTELCGRITHAEDTTVYTRPARLLSVLPIAGNDSVEVQVFAGVGAGLSTPPQVGDVIECAGYLYASPDAVVEAAESWQDSGEIAALQETREREQSALKAYEKYSGYSLAQGVAAAAFARAGYTLLPRPCCHTREQATLAVQAPQQGEQSLIFVDTLVSNREPAYHFTQEQCGSILTRERTAAESELSAIHCLVRLHRMEESENYRVELYTEPACPALLPEHTICEAMQCPLPGAMTEERACRILCRAVATQEWSEFARAAAEDMLYSSLVNGTRTEGKIEYIRYMAERKQLWAEQMGWPGMRMETGTIEHEGARRPCFMLHCYGRMVGASVVRLRGGFIAEIVTLPTESNATYAPDEESTAPRSLYHPLRGRLIPFTTRQSPLQRFAAAYLQERMRLSVGFIPPDVDPAAPLKNHPVQGVEFSLRKQGARWLKLVRNGPTFCDLAFAYAGRIYAVCAVECAQDTDFTADAAKIVAAVPELPLLLETAERYGLVPCVFPAKRDYTPDPHSTWNLLHAATLQPVFPEKAERSAPAPPSDWEITNAALTDLVRATERSGGSVIGCHDLPHLLPHFWFYDANGLLSWVIVRPHSRGAHTDSIPTAAELQTARLLPGTRGYVVDAEAWGNAAHTAPAFAGEPLYLRLCEPQLVELD